ncbi:2-C-methyl-D-erythritol 4-phosphate cytidylyltransferase [Sporosarcina thermotolerans]|uniref:2-C-methyl-D-erythritol 4-phosphate cytidylyltransferase n=1 Tax=Sporosarcina thermotolerans TaxID=633404 RepID=A0AAW9A6F4_9BACL|nr:2-C-methyl-D-erythritol 4-phosphate cytidylyltransferase [Sporosarcina thermotolerans]MDW0116722.1 2-C-methyl-D-erythritol 4-phosphate cytidylyltransferase [Sporosarcina thermotolerans]WHT48910.1 2-C-methyl-D-erythritol 4-phosphate cytidylyltransferase [Sporosarcina thermotolerans]
MKMYTVMLPAAGSGRRMGAGFNKLFLELAGKPILIHTLEVFEQDEKCSGMILSVKLVEKEKIERMLERFGITKVKALVEGGDERQQSVAACIRAHQSDEIVLVHDAARPFINRNVIHELVGVADEHGAAIAGVQVKDTMKFAPDGIVEETVDRSKLWSIQTPQAFRYELLKEASDKAEADGFLGTDESMIVERLGHPVRIVESTYDNVKMTTKEDLLFGEVLLKRRQ